MDSSTAGRIVLKDPVIDRDSSKSFIAGLRVPARAGIYFALCLTGLILNVAFTLKLPWGGDEWYTYHESPVMAAPNGALVFLARKLFGEVSVHNYVFYRQIGLLWFSLTIAFLIYKDFKHHFQPLFLFQSVFLVLSSFVIFQVQYFRYYAFYLFCSILFFYLILHVERTGYVHRRIPVILCLLISPLLYVALTWQLGVFVAVNEVRLMDKRRRLIAIPFLIAAGFGAIVFSNKLLAAAIHFVYSKVSVGAIGRRGLTVGGLLKPIYATFQFAFGYDVEPTENMIVAVVFLLIAGGFLYRLWRLRRTNRPLFNATIIGGIIPFVLLYWLLEPLTPPGSTELESKQALFFLPFFVSVFVPSRDDGKRIRSWLPACVLLVAAVLGLHVTLTRVRVNWPQVVAMAREVQRQGGPVLIDGRANESFFFYAEGKIDRDGVYFLTDPKLKQVVTNAPVVAAITNDWTSYQMLTREQNWNAGSGSEARVSAVENLLASLRSGKECVQSYVHYPLFAFVYARQTSSPAQPKPGFFEIPYQDINFPIAKDGVTTLGWQDVRIGQPFAIPMDRAGQVSIYYSIETSSGAKEGERIGSIKTGAGEVPLQLGMVPTDKFQSEYSRSLERSEVWYEWKKRPVVTQSLKYPGSLFSSTGKIFKTDFIIPANGTLVIEKANLVLHLCAIKIDHS
jgi:hypothetical protein